MTLFEMLSTKKFKLSGNIDERYFKPNDDGTYSATPLFIHNVARDIVKDIKSYVISTDDATYVKHTPKADDYTVKDTWEEHEHNAEWGVKYKKQTEAFDKKWKEYRDSHPDEFKQNESTIAVGDIPTARFFSAYHPDFSGKSVSELMSMYKEALELSNRYGDNTDLRNTLPQRPGNLTSKEEFVVAHKAIKKKFAEEVGLPEDTWVCPRVHKDEVISLVSTNSKVFKSITNADGDKFNDYISGLIDHITSSTPEAYQKEWEELYTKIEDVCDNLTRGGRGTKLNIQKSNAKNAMNISIFTSDIGSGEPRRKLANISKVEPKDDFYTFTLFITSGGKRPVRKIATKADLRDVFENLIDVLEDNDLKEYIDCVQNAIDSIL